MKNWTERYSSGKRRFGRVKDKEKDISQPARSADIKNKLLWTVVFVVLAVMSVVAVTNMSKDFTVENFVSYIKGSSPSLICAAVISMLGFVIFEGLALLAVVKGFGYKQKFIHGLIYSASDIYVSAITPSATGGQAAPAYFMSTFLSPGRRSGGWNRRPPSRRPAAACRPPAIPGPRWPSPGRPSGSGHMCCPGLRHRCCGS